MSIRKKIILSICVTFFILLVSCFALVQYVLLGQFRQAEKSYVESSISSTESILKSYLNNLSLKLTDWARWDDTYQFVSDKNSDFEKSNLGSNSISQINIDLMIFIDQKGEIVKSVEIDKDKSLVPLSDSLVSYLQKNKDKFIARDVESKSEGIIILPEGPLIFSSMSILKSDGTGPVGGELFFGKYFDKIILDYLSNITHLNTEFKIYGDKNLPPDFELAKKMFGESLYFVNPVNSSDVAGYLLVKDEAESPGLIVRIDMQRDIYSKGAQALMVMLLLIVLIVLFSVITFYISLNKFVISKIIKLSLSVSGIREKKDPGLRIPLSGGSGNGNDEIFGLAKNINSMIDDLGEARTQEEEERDQLKTRIEAFEKKNKELEDSQKAIINILDDTKQLEEELEMEKKGVEKKVLERTSQLMQEQARLQASISSLPLGFIMTDAKKNVLMMNGIAKSILCAQSEGNSAGIVTKESLEHSNCNLQEMQKKLKGSFDLKFAVDKAMKDKKPFEVKELALEDIFLHIFIVPIVTVNEKELLVVGSVMLVENITERKIIERSRDEFFSIASHELRTPLTAIRGNTALIKQYYWDKIKDTDLREMVLDIHESSTRLIGIVNDFLDTSRLELGKMEFKKEEMDAELLIKEVLKEYVTTGSMKKLYLKAQKPRVKIPLVVADRDRVKQILINLIGNAIKFTDKGGITVSFEAEKSFVKILVSDTGKGISSESQNLLFRKFQQAAESIFTRDAIHGTGLGLYISKMMASAMGGRVTLESSVVNKGSVFSVSLPIAGKTITQKKKAAEN
jgi:signal transduction histidine kinase/sensor domain CHASE-containing protein